MVRRAPLKRAADWFSSIATTVQGWLGAYFATDPRRKPMQGMRPQQATANQALTANLWVLRAHCRQLERNNPTARAAIEGLVACVVGSGIALEPDSGDAKADELIRAEWLHFCQNCTADGHDLYWLQAQGFREVVTAGEALWRAVILPERAHLGDVPYAILPLEAEWIAESNFTPIYDAATGLVHLGGLDLDMMGRTQFYNLRNPEFGATPQGIVERVPALEVLHVYERRRALQARGEPWMAPIIETLYQERDLVVAELQAAKNTAGLAVAITSELHDPPKEDQNQDPVTDIPVGSTVRLFPGEKVETISHTRPSQQIAPFRQMLRGDIAAAMRIPQRFLDRDISGANYSSMRADMLDTERILSPVREWYGHATAGRIYRDVLPWLALRAGIKAPKPAYRLIPDGQPYVDPEKDAKAAVFAIAAGLSTWEKEIGKRGEDAKKVLETLTEELKNPILETIFAANLAGGKGAPAEPESEKDQEEDDEATEKKQKSALFDAEPVAAPPQNLNVNVTVEREEAAKAVSETKRKYEFKYAKNGLIESVDRIA